MINIWFFGDSSTGEELHAILDEGAYSFVFKQIFHFPEIVRVLEEGKEGLFFVEDRQVKENVDRWIIFQSLCKDLKIPVVLINVDKERGMGLFNSDFTISYPLNEKELNILFRSYSFFHEESFKFGIGGKGQSKYPVFGYLRQFLEELAFPIVWKDRNFRIYGCNNAFLTYFNFLGKDSVIGKKESEIFDESFLSVFPCLDEEVAHSKKSILDKRAKVQINGVEYFFNKSENPLLDEKGQIITVVEKFFDATKYRKAFEDLNQEKIFMQILMDNIPDSIYFKDRNYRFIKVNKAKLDNLGVTSIEEVLGKTDFDFFSKEDASKTHEDEVKIIENGDRILNKIEQITRKGKAYYVSATKIPISDGTSNIIGLVGVSRNITAHRLLEIERDGERKLFRELIDQTKDIIFFKNHDLKYIRINHAGARALGVPEPEMVIGKTCFDFYEEEVASQLETVQRKVLATGESFDNLIFHYFEKQGSRRWLNFMIMPLSDGHGTIVGIVGFARDITENKKLEDSLLLEKKLLQSLMDNVPDAIFYKDINSKYIRVNQSMASLYHTSVETLIGHSDYDFLSGKLAQKYEKEDQSIFSTGKPIIDSLSAVRKEKGIVQWYSTSKIPLRDERGRITGLVGISRNMTQNEELKKKLQYAKDKAEEANKAKSLFLANMSHEIRTPMNGVIGMSDILKRTKLSAEQEDYVNVIIKSGNNLLAIINDVLDFSKIESGKMDLEKSIFSVRSVIEDTADIFILKAAEKKLDLVTYIAPDVPDFVKGDPVRLRQILTNLVNNALKFTSTGEVVIYANLVNNKKGRVELKFNVRDTGIGISEEVKAKLFQPFTQADSSITRKYGGTGLGLAISKRLIEQMGGTIGLNSVEGQGADFYFNCFFDQCEKTEVNQNIRNVNFSALNILVVDDNSTNRYIFEQYFKLWHCEYTSVTNGKDALLAMQQAEVSGIPFDLALIDYQMVGMDGIELATLVRNDPEIAGIHLVLLSSVSNFADRADEVDKLFESRLHKPIKLIQLYKVITEVVNNNIGEADIEESFRNIDLKDLKILVAEDNEINQRVVKLMLRDVASVLDVVTNGQEVYEKFKEGGYNVILMDVQMPIMNGFEATKVIRKWEKDHKKRNQILIIAMTANAMKEDMDYCLSIGMDGYLNKPFKTDDLIALLKRLVP